MKIVDSGQMSKIDRRSQTEFGIPSIVLMENAGIKAVAAFKRFIWGGSGPASPLVFAAGKGNNGGDALVMARQCLLDGQAKISIVLAGGRPAADTDPGRNLLMCESLGIPVVPFPEEEEKAVALLDNAEWVFDGITGTGISGALREPFSALVSLINASPARKAAVDVPSGIGDGYRAGYPAIRADVTLAIGLPKRCLYLPHARPLCGKIIVVPLGFPPALTEDPSIPGEILVEDAFNRLLPPLPPDAYKNTRGHLAVFAGAPGTTGAAWLCATAAARARTGLVTAFLDPGVYPLIASKFSSVMTKPWDGPSAESGSGVDQKRFSAILVGPGWGLRAERKGWLEYLLSLGLPGVIDADALSLLGTLHSESGIRLGGRWVLTPHPGEFSRLSGVPKDEVLDDPISHSISLAERLDAVIVLKGACTFVVVPGGKYWIFDGVNPALGTGGSGDVLAGIIAAGVAAGLNPLDAALFGVSLHGKVGRLARSRRGWFLAEDLLPLISWVLAREE
jgi:NAD(P)H-hydrate epimerase